MRDRFERFVELGRDDIIRGMKAWGESISKTADAALKIATLEGQGWAWGAKTVQVITF